jgi:protein O-GlcNAc transferase
VHKDPLITSANDLAAQGRIFLAQGRISEAVAYLQDAVSANPKFGSLRAELADALTRSGEYREATDVYIRAAAAGFTHPAVLNNLGGALIWEGRIGEAVDVFRAALKIDPQCSALRSNLLLMLNSLDEYSPEALSAEHRLFGVHLPARKEAFLHTNSRDPSRRLRVGYVSGCFRAHSVTRFFEPVLRAHDRQAFRITCFSKDAASDSVTERLRSAAHDWQDIALLNAEAAATLIAEERIDILIDLDGHTAGNALATFALRPAPVQVSWLGYPNTTGLTQMDYRITDSVADPPGLTDPWHTETLVRLDPIFLPWTPIDDAPAVGPLPALSRGSVTFASFNQLHKLSRATVKAMAAVLAAVPGSRLLLKSAALVDPKVCLTHRRRFAEHGISPERILCSGFLSSRRDHLDLYNSADIALDSFPYTGTTTTCESLWMGLPVVTLQGRNHAARVSASILRAAGLTSLIAQDETSYVAIAARLASDLTCLAEQRRGLRGCMSRSPQMDIDAFVRRLECAYRSMWTAWRRA